MTKRHKILEAPGLWLEGAAVAQLETASRLAGMRFAFGLPDLHPGKGIPVGAAFFGDALYPHLVGSDIGCGVGVWRVLGAKKPQPEKWSKKLRLDEPLGEEAALEALAARGVDAAAWRAHLRGFGTIGRGNHFAEIGVCEAPAEGSPLADGELALWVHSGSRAFGEALGLAHWAARGARALDPASEEGAQWLLAQPVALAFAEENRKAIARRLLEQLGLDGEPILDTCHNFAERVVAPASEWAPLGLSEATEPEELWVVRKGAASARRGLVGIAGSRGTPSVVFEPAASVGMAASGWSLAHGAGRKWARSECRGRLSSRFGPEQLRRPLPGSFVVCDDKDLLFEEAPQAYKDIDPVIAALVAAGAGRALCRTRPILSYKTRSDDCC
jgi:release factor H-coupled RctB family protein